MYLFYALECVYVVQPLEGVAVEDERGGVQLPLGGGAGQFLKAYKKLKHHQLVFSQPNHCLSVLYSKSLEKKMEP